jgi:hypothetical protein
MLIQLAAAFLLFDDKRKKMHGIEPGPPAWQASILPLNHQCFYLTIHFNAKLKALALSYSKLKQIISK